MGISRYNSNPIKDTAVFLYVFFENLRDKYHRERTHSLFFSSIIENEGSRYIIHCFYNITPIWIRTEEKAFLKGIYLLDASPSFFILCFSIFLSQSEKVFRIKINNTLPTARSSYSSIEFLYKEFFIARMNRNSFWNFLSPGMIFNCFRHTMSISENHRFCKYEKPKQGASALTVVISFAKSGGYTQNERNVLRAQLF